MVTIIKRPRTILESLDEGFKQIEEFKQGKRKLKTIDESIKLWEQWAKEEEDTNGRVDCLFNSADR